MKCANKNLYKIPFGKKVLGANKSKDEKRSEAAVWRCFTKQVFLKILQNSQENTYAGVTV